MPRLPAILLLTALIALAAPAGAMQTGWREEANGTRRVIQWDEDNRIAEIIDNGERSQYTYDDQGQRVIKQTRQGETVYVNPYYVVRNRSIVSKHVFAGSSRLATRLVSGTAPGNQAQGAGSNPQATTGQGQANSGQGNNNSLSRAAGEGRGEGGGQSNAHGQSKDNPGQGRERRSDTANAHAQDIHKNPTLTGAFPGQGEANRSSRANQVAQNIHHNPQLVASVDLAGEGTTGADPLTDSAPTRSQRQAQAAGQSEFLYYYHPDHLGSTGHVTDANGKLYEHVAYFPFGETWVREHSNTLRTPYLFTGKELDAETGLYYFGARYYDPRTSVWASVDPIIEEYLSGKRNDGVFNSRNLAFYGYAYQNPIRLVDPDGNNPGPITVPGMFPMVDYRSGNAVVDNTALGAVNTVINVANSLGNIAARGLGALGEALPDPGVIQSAGMAVHPTLGMGVGAAARGLVTLARMDKAAGATVAAAKGETTVVGRVKDLQNLKQGEKSLLDRLPDQGSPKANWKQNSGVLRQEMGKGEPIRDASPGDTAGQFLNAERNLLTDRGWTFDSKTNNWNPPAQ